MRRRLRPALVVLSAGLVVTACGTDGAGPTTSAGDADACPGAVVDVVVSVGQWGDVVEALGGDCASVTTVIGSTAVDPHEFEPTPGDLAAFEEADLVVLNGAGYDSWAADAAGNLDPAPVVLDLAEVVGVEDDEHEDDHAGAERAEEQGGEHAGAEGHGHGGVNPHVWYAPDLVQRAAEAVTTELGGLSPAAAGHFADRAAAWREELAPYLAEIESLRAAAGGRSYAATESVFEYMAEAIGLTDATPEGYRESASNETDPTPGDVAAFESLLRSGGVDVLVHNSQTDGGVPDQLRATAEEAGIPVVEVTESGTERGGSFVDWQLAQLRALSDALARRG
ncbi:metal ABC transporter solute-binding protein, Zn/Mn family [Trujillonella endophytica]|uniref:Zinc/manganese transport system substrate-binding protein n=1 Tax=Trujillonella endophytica TaxID=673521 RepID=A0A1H8UU10_9ACTN|nr:zinc ABC transporter substrate-binding protein [Trujillella endophytica]SEP06404.1 zinc/manganese transport system substrate-binding protein [Trujillella endophytica]